MENVLIDVIFKLVEIVDFEVLILGKAFLAVVLVGDIFTFKPLYTNLNHLLTGLANDGIVSLDVVLTKLVAQREPSFSEIVVSRK